MPCTKYSSPLIAMGLVACLLPAAVASADELQHDQLAANAKWYLHVDLDAMRSSTLGRNIIEHQTGDKHADRLAWIERHTGMRPHEQLTSILIYGTDFEHRQGVAIFQGDFDRDRIIDRLAGAPGYQSLDPANDTHRIALPGDTQRDLYLAFHNASLILASDRSRLITALATRTGRAEPLPADSPLLAGDREGAMFQFGATDLSQMHERQANLMQAADRMSMAIVEHDGRVALQGSVTADDERRAQQLYDAMRGMKAMAMLQSEELSPLFEQARLHRAGEHIEFTWSVPARDVIDMLEAYVR
ncbi:hypothetical protein ACERK3_14855 [Phycisphaerales bacterium AB-hyl4]|uniref:DUF2066 domain-containing protein n=1 Tax=Natronomicrosphaera hydrolytica TaxID=3242702 RepID=A0ABV4U7I3_9BACT